MKSNQLSITLTFLLIVIVVILISFISLYWHSIRLDEAQSIWISTKSLVALWELTAQDVNLPLYGTILHFWLQIFGINIVYARMLSLIFFILTIPVLFLMVKEVGNKKLGVLTILLFSFSPFIVWYSSESRTYTLFVLIISLNHLFFLKFLKTSGMSGKLGYFLSTTLGLYTHYFFLFLLSTQGIYILGKLIKEKIEKNKKNFSTYKNLTYSYFLILFSGFSLLTPWIAYVINEGAVANTQPLIPPPTSYNIIQTFVNFVFGFQPQIIQTTLVSMWPLLIVLLFLVFTQKRRVNTKYLGYFFLMTIMPVVMVFLISFIKPIFLSRYLILVTPSLFFLIAWILLSQPRKTSFFLTTLFLAGLFGLLLYQNTSAVTPVREDYSQVVEYLNTYTTFQDIVTVSAPFTIYPIEYQYKGKAKLTTIPEWDRYIRGSIPDFTQEGLVSQINDYKTKYNRLFLILSYDQGYKKDVRQYMDNNFALIGDKSFPSGIDMRIYKLKYD